MNSSGRYPIEGLRYHLEVKIFRTVFLCFACLVLPFAAAAQGTQASPPATPPAAPPPPEYKWFAGGAVGLAFGNQVNYLEFSPIIGYQLFPRFQIGGSITFRYSKDKRYEPDLSTTDFGASLVGRYFVFGPIFVQAEFERIRFGYPVRTEDDLIVAIESTYSGLYGGFGFVQQAGGRGALYMSFLWDFNYDKNEPNPRNDPFQIQIGYGIRF